MDCFLLIIFHLCIFSDAVVSLGYNDSCIPSEDLCDPVKGFKCQEDVSLCRCSNVEEMVYMSRNDSCEVFVGGNCDSPDLQGSLSCIDSNARCRWDQVAEGVRCNCNQGYWASEEDAIHINVKCLPIYPDYLCNDTNLPCHGDTNMICEWGRCQCVHPLKQVFDQDQLKCLGAVEALNSCNPEEDGPPQCQKNAYCGEDRKCHCSPGWSADFGMPPTCKIHHGQPCDMAQYNSCNLDRGFRCMQDLCRCTNDPDAWFDPEKQVCAVREGNACNLLDAVPAREGVLQTLSYLTCASGLECVKNGDQPYFGVCAQKN